MTIIKLRYLLKDYLFQCQWFFIDDQLFVTEKDSGKILKISENGILQETPSLIIATDPTYRGLEPTERVEYYKEEIECHCGLLGITYNGENVFVYHTGVASEIENRPNIVTKYKFDGTSFVEPKTMKTMEGSSRDHAGGIVTKGWDGEIYFVIGDQDKYYNIHANIPNGTEEDVASIFMIKDDKIERFAMGIRNSFGMAVDPFTGKLWATENGPAHYDEINLVQKKFNSGWNVLSGPIDRFEKEKRVFEDSHPEGEGYDDLSRLGFEDFEYSDPEFSWEVPVGVTAIEFPNLNSFGDYSQFVFVGDFNTGSIYNFKLNEDRDGFDFSHEGLTDLVYDWDDRFKSEEIFFAKIIPGGISDIEFQDDGMYVSTIYDGTIYKISSKTILPPLKQQKIGIVNEEIVCVDEHMPIMDKSGRIVCVTPLTALSLQEHGWKINSENMPKIVLKNQNLNGLNFEGMDLSHSDFRNVDFKNVNISNVDFSNANLAHTDLSEKNLEGINMKGALLRGANLDGANLIGVDLSYKDLTEVILRNQDLSETNLTGARLTNADFTGTDLSGINLVEVSFFETDLPDKNFRGTNLKNAFFYGAKLHNANFEDANLLNAKLINANLKNSNFKNSNLEGADFEDANLEGVNLSNVNLEGANLEGANLSGTMLPSDMSNMNLKNIKLIGTDLVQKKIQ